MDRARERGREGKRINIPAICMQGGASGALVRFDVTVRAAASLHRNIRVNSKRWYAPAAD